MTTKVLLTLAAPIVTLAVVLSPAQASIITVKFEAVASGSIDNVDFTDESILVTTNYNTENVTTFANGFFVINESAVIQVGSSAFNVTSTTSHAFNNDNSVATFGNDDTQFDAIILESPVFATYDGSTSLGPIAGDAFFSSAAEFNTDGGEIEFADASFVSTVFQSAAVPEPSAFAVWALGCIAMFAKRRTRAAPPQT